MTTRAGHSCLPIQHACRCQSRRHVDSLAVAGVRPEVWESKRSGILKSCQFVFITGRREPERLFLFVYTAYLDESGTHDGSPITVMGGLFARAEEWRSFEDKFDEARELHDSASFTLKSSKDAMATSRAGPMRNALPSLMTLRF